MTSIELSSQVQERRHVTHDTVRQEHLLHCDVVIVVEDEEHTALQHCVIGVDDESVLCCDIVIVGVEDCAMSNSSMQAADHHFCLCW